ncbi:helix-turn-helix domain-containing protein [Planotetraspora phitsanulokensis]|nr:helix-turn-helix domain-containing protein [Planotetraspora phitsanulokensis]
MADALMTPEQLAEYLRVSPEWVYKNIYDLPFVRIGKSYRFPKGDVDEWLRSSQYCGLPPKFFGKQV